MKTIILAMLVLLTGCASSNVKDVLTNLQGCKRHYAGAIGGVAAGAITFTIDCDPANTDKAVAVPVPARP